jgi:putative oxidoreductase
MKNIINAVSRFCRRRSVGLFFIRAVTGSVFIAHGWDKINNIAGVTAMLTHMGVVSPELFGPFIAWLEVVGGIALFLGVLPRIFGAALGIEMLFAIFLSGIGRGFHAHELELMLMASSFGIAFIGSGWISIFRLECALCGGMLCAKDEDCPKRQPG